MRKLSILLISILIFLLTSCQKKEETVEDYNAERMGVFLNEKASLTIDSISDGAFGETIDYQFEFITDEKSGTLFGSADSNPEGGFKDNMEVLSVIHNIKLNYENGNWLVEYTPENPENKDLFDYSGTYKKKKE